MSIEPPEDMERIKERWDERAERYDGYYETFHGAVEQHVEWALLKEHLPEDNRARILDAAGGTGRLALRFARMGYSVALCDLSPGMLGVAKGKMAEAGVSDRVTFVECDVRKLSFPDASFDFVLCWGAGLKAASELARVAKSGATLSMCTANRVGTAIRRFHEDPEHALALLTSRSDHDHDKEERYRVATEEEARGLLARDGIKMTRFYAYDLWRPLAIPADVLESHDWDERFFAQTAEMMTRLASEPSVCGLSSHGVVYGEKI